MRLQKIGSAAILATLAASSLMIAKPAQADTAGSFVGGVVGGVAGTLINNAIAPQPRVIYQPAPAPVVYPSTPVVYPPAVQPVYPTPVVYPTTLPPQVRRVLSMNGLLYSACQPGTVHITLPNGRTTCAMPTAYVPAGYYYAQPRTLQLVSATTSPW